MKLTLIGGGGFRVPQVISAVATAGPVDDVVLVDTDAARLAAIRQVVEGQPRPRRLRVTATTSLEEALPGSDFVFCAIRVGGTAARVQDERIALDRGILGQETTGPGGLSYAWRTIPVMRHIATLISQLAPQAWLVNFTNPAGIVTESLRSILGPRVVGICDTPIGLVRRAAAAIGVPGDSLSYDYVGLNHLGWLRSLTVDGVNRLPDLIDDPVRLASVEEARLVGVDWVRQLGVLPNEYLFYYYCDREAVARIREATATRGEYLDAQQAGFYGAAAGDPAHAYLLWQQAKAAREQSYMAEARPAGEAREAGDADGGYQNVAVALMMALAGEVPTTAIVNVGNGTTIPGLPEDAVIEVPCAVDASGVRPLPVGPVEGHQLGLMQSVKACEQLAIQAAVDHDPGLAWQALACHPLVDSAAVARELLAGYRARIPEVGAVFAG